MSGKLANGTVVIRADINFSILPEPCDIQPPPNKLDVPQKHLEVRELLQADLSLTLSSFNLYFSDMVA
jgi:hypothetical protein